MYVNQDMTVMGLLAIIGLATLLNSIRNGTRFSNFMATITQWKLDVERRIENLEDGDR